MTVLRPHGSINWGWALPNQAEVPRSESAERAVSALDATVGEPSSLVVFEQPVHRAPGELAPVTIPALALPLPAKSESQLVWPPEQAAFFDRLQTRVRRLLVVGWRAAEPEIVARLQRMVMTDARVLVVSGGPDAEGDARETSGNLGLMHRLEERSPNGFSELFNSQGLDWLLEEVNWRSP